jgi:hypothetical protein
MLRLLSGKFDATQIEDRCCELAVTDFRVNALRDVKLILAQRGSSLAT